MRNKSRKIFEMETGVKLSSDFSVFMLDPIDGSRSDINNLVATPTDLYKKYKNLSDELCSFNLDYRITESEDYNAYKHFKRLGHICRQFGNATRDVREYIVLRDVKLERLNKNLATVKY